MTIVPDVSQDVVELLGTCSGKDGGSIWINVNHSDLLTVIERIEIYHRPCANHIICGIFFQAECHSTKELIKRTGSPFASVGT